MELPPGYEVPENMQCEGRMVCKLQKSIYCLKKASRQWFLKFSSTICSLGFWKSYGDHTLFTRFTDGIFIAVLVYEDDIIIASTDDSVILELVE